MINSKLIEFQDIMFNINDNYDLFVLKKEDSDSNIILLNGIKMSDINRKNKKNNGVPLRDSLSKIHRSETNKISYTSPPDKITSIQSWIKSTNLYCANCKRKHSNVPIPIIHYLNDDNSMILYGQLLCCSFPCAQRFINYNFSIYEKSVKTTLLKRFYTLLTGQTINVIKESLDPYRMLYYIGEKDGISIDEFIEYNNSIIDIGTYKI